MLWITREKFQRHWSYLIDNLNITDVVNELNQGVDGEPLITHSLYERIMAAYTS